MLKNKGMVAFPKAGVAIFGIFAPALLPVSAADAEEVSWHSSPQQLLEETLKYFMI